MPTKRELYQRSNLFHTTGKPLADKKELCSPLHAFIWLLLAMQQGKKKRVIISKGSQDGWNHTPLLRMQTCSPWLETLQGSANWHLSKHPAARAAWEPCPGALISPAGCVVIPPRESPPSKQREKFPPVHSDCLPGWIKGSHGCGFSLLTPEVSELLPSQKERQNILGHVHCESRSRELSFSVCLRDCYFRAMNLLHIFPLSCFNKTPHLCFPASPLSKPIFHS